MDITGATNPAARHWCFVDQLGPHLLDDPGQPVLLIESRAVFERRRFHRRKAHLVLPALRHRAAGSGVGAAARLGCVAAGVFRSHRVRSRAAVGLDGGRRAGDPPRIDPVDAGARVSIEVPWWSAPYLKACAVAVRRVEDVLT